MIMESLVTLMAIIAFIILGTISHALMQDITDPITGRTVRDKEARRMGMFGYALCCGSSLSSHPILYKDLIIKLNMACD